MEDIFSSFDDEPIGAASIGQVHLATLRESNRPVVVKVQYPEVEGFFRMDLLTIKTLCGLMLPNSNTDSLFDEFGKSFESEFDYRLEAQHLRTCGDNLVGAGFANVAFIPEPVDGSHRACPSTHANGLCTRRVMVMDRVPGRSVKKVMKDVFEEMAQAQGKTVEALMDEMKSQFEDPDKLRALLNTPPPSETSVRLGLALLTLCDWVRNVAVFGYNYTVGLLGDDMAYEWTTIPPNGPRLTRILYDVHG